MYGRRFDSYTLGFDMRCECKGAGVASSVGRLVRRGAAVIAIVLGVPFATLAQPAPKIAAASSLGPALTEVAAQFRRETGMRVDPVFASSGALARQIQEGAPFEVFLAADEDLPNRLAKAGRTRDAGVVYALGRLALFAPHGSPLTVDPQLNGLATLLAAGKVTRFAVANPAFAPYGAAAEAVLARRGLLTPIRPALVMGSTIAQAAQFASSGNAVGGLLAYSLVLAPEFRGRGSVALIDAADHPPIRHRMVLLRNAGPAAQRFYQFVQGPTARATFARFGFSMPE